MYTSSGPCKAADCFLCAEQKRVVRGGQVSEDRVSLTRVDLIAYLVADLHAHFNTCPLWA